MKQRSQQPRLLLAGLGAVLLLTAGASQGESFRVESVVTDTVSARALGTSRADGAIDEFFVAQKKMVVDILDGLGIPFDSLPANVRDGISRYQTRNFAAFTAYSKGLNALDQGRFAEAKAFFDKAVELDPDFGLAKQMEGDMPQTNVYSGLQLQSVLRDAAKSATTSGQTLVEVDVSRAVAALLSGQAVVVGTRSDASAATPTSTGVGSGYTSNEPGSASQYANRTVVGLAYTRDADTAAPIQLATTSEWTIEQIRMSDNALTAVGDSGFSASRDGATLTPLGSYALNDGSNVYWGTWNSSPGASASVTVVDADHITHHITHPKLGAEIQYMIGQATQTMPGTGSVVFLPREGFLTGVAGSIGVNFVNRAVTLNDLGFSTQGFTFSQLNGGATYDNSIGSGSFNGNYTSGTCIQGCAAFSPSASAFNGNFVGAGADGVILSHIMQTGARQVGGVQLFAR